MGLGLVIIFKAIDGSGVLGKEVIKGLDGAKKSWVQGGVSDRLFGQGGVVHGPFASIGQLVCICCHWSMQMVIVNCQVHQGGSILVLQHILSRCIDDP